MLTTGVPNVEPVRVKLYGLFSMTRRRYMTQLVVAGLLVVALLVVWLVYCLTIRQQARGLPSLEHVVLLLDLLPWIALGLGALQALEAFVVLRAFARKQAGQPPVEPP
jgi:hypothetical protein